jgi:hypothetical protein
MVALIKIAVQLLADAARFSILLFRPTRSVQAENLFLRRQLALFKERGIQPRRVDSATRISLAMGEGVVVLAKSVLDGLHHEYSMAPSVA